jgi:hypothetical protein
MTNINFSKCEKFFGISGYTSTSANYLANKAKEIAEGFGTDRISFINTRVKPINSEGTGTILERGISETEFDAIIERKLMICKLNGLISWCREAIKAKDKMLAIAENYTFATWMHETYPEISLDTFGAELEENIYPEDIRMTADEWVSQNMSIKEMNEYLYLLAACSTLGKFIHPNGEYANARATAIKKNGTAKINDFQSSTVMYNFETSVDMGTVEKKFFELQEMHRDNQKRLNAIKFRIENELQKLNDKYSMLVDEYNKVEAENVNKVDAARKKYRAEFNAWRINKLDEIRKLKIIMPNELKDVVDFVNNVQKQ